MTLRIGKTPLSPYRSILPVLLLLHVISVLLHSRFLVALSSVPAAPSLSASAEAGSTVGPSSSNSYWTGDGSSVSRRKLIGRAGRTLGASGSEVVLWEGASGESDGPQKPVTADESTSARINGADLSVVSLGFYAGGGDGRGRGGGCKGGSCSDFSPCSGALGQIEACWNREFVDLLDQTPNGQQKKFPAFCPEIPDELEMTRVVPAQCADSVSKMKRFWEEQGEWPESLHVEIPDPGSQKEWSGQVFRLRNVFVNWRGQMFNQTHLFDTGRCGDRLADFDYPLGTRFATFPALLNLLSTALSPSDVVFSEMAEKLPLFLSLAPAMSLLRRIPVAVQNRKLVRGIWQAVVGLRPTASAIHAMAHSSLLFARTLYM
ncbi:unnamed protein product, partial [Closterium sp. NIES-54]